MHLICLSVSHHNTPVELRECLSMSSSVIANTALTIPIRSGKFEQISELVFISTCNRLEIYAIVSLPLVEKENANFAAQLLLSYLREAMGPSIDALSPYFRFLHNISTVEHLFHVTAGLDSIAIGETQILGQVSHALDIALDCGSARHVLSSLFRSAIHAGKLVRHETEIGRRPISISSLGVQFAQSTLGTLVNTKVMVIGAGKIGEYAIKSLIEIGVRQPILINRTYQRAAELIAKYEGIVMPYELLSEGLREADVVFTSTSAPQPILHKKLITEIMANRPHRPMTFIDLAVPRNVETGVKDIAGVQLFDMDDLQQYVGQTEISYHPHIELAKSIISKEVEDYEKLLRVVPIIGKLHKKAEQIRQHEVTRTVRHLSNPDDKTLEQIDLLSRALVRKILHDPTMQLRSEKNQETLNEYVETLSRLFDLKECEPIISSNQDGKWKS
jgi:glutamyl-tRNA reductase